MSEDYPLCPDCRQSNPDHPYYPCKACALWQEEKLKEMKAEGIPRREGLERVRNMRRLSDEEVK
jgi:hypothetical protein